MKKENKFNQAVILSIILHCCMLPFLYWLSASLLSAAAVEEVLELEMVNDSPPAVLSQLIQLPAAPQAAAMSVPMLPTPAMSVLPTEAVATQIPNAVSQPTAQQANTIPALPGGMPGVSDNAGNSALSGGSSSAINPGTGSGESVAPAPSPPPKTGIVTPPKILSRTEPSYPQDARNKGVEGSVRVRIEVGEDGQPSSCSIVGSSGSASLDNAALQAVREWSFVPAKDQDTGEAVRCYTSVSVVFNLN